MSYSRNVWRVVNWPVSPYVRLIIGEPTLWQQNVTQLWGDSRTIAMVIMQNLWTNLTSLCHICWKLCSPIGTHDWFCSYFWANHDGCHMRGRTCSLVPERLMSPTFGSSWFHPFLPSIHEASPLKANVSIIIYIYIIMPILSSAFQTRPHTTHVL